MMITFQITFAKIFALMGYYAAYSGNFLPTFRDNTSKLYSKSRNQRNRLLLGY